MANVHIDVPMATIAFEMQRLQLGVILEIPVDKAAPDDFFFHANFDALTGTRNLADGTSPLRILENAITDHGADAVVAMINQTTGENIKSRALVLAAEGFKKIDKLLDVAEAYRAYLLMQQPTRHEWEALQAIYRKAELKSAPADPKRLGARIRKLLIEKAGELHQLIGRPAGPAPAGSPHKRRRPVDKKLD